MGVKDDIQALAWELGEMVSFAPSRRRYLHGSRPWPMATRVEHTAWKVTVGPTRLSAPPLLHTTAATGRGSPGPR